MKRVSFLAAAIAVLTMAMTIDVAAGKPALQPAAEAPAAAFWLTRWVTQSQVPIAAPVVTSRTLPETLSFDALTDGEIQAIRQDLYDRVKNTPLIDPMRHVAGADGCMQWVFQRWGRDQAWRAVGFQADGGWGLIKLNGALRRVSFDYTINYDLNELIGKGRVRVESSAGLSTIWTFTPQASFAQASASAQSDHALRLAGFRGAHGSRFRWLSFGWTKAVAIVQRDAPCSLLKARCRRYEFEATQAAQWLGMQRVEAPDGAYYEEPVAAIADAPLAFAIEDMCPFAQAAMVERQYSRMTGRGSLIKGYGLPGNAPLRDALRPYAK